jgi:hypothetical protein
MGVKKRMRWLKSFTFKGGKEFLLRKNTVVTRNAFTAKGSATEESDTCLSTAEDLSLCRRERKTSTQWWQLEW